MTTWTKQTSPSASSWTILPSITTSSWTKSYSPGENVMDVIMTGLWDDTQLWQDDKIWWDGGSGGSVWTII